MLTNAGSATTITNPTMATTPAALLIAAGARRNVLIVNSCTGPLWIGTTNAVTSGGGIPIAVGGNYQDNDGIGAWWGILASGGGTATVSVQKAGS